MDLKDQILNPESFKENEGKNLASRISNDKDLVKELLEGFLDNDARFRQRSSWVMLCLAEQYPHTLIPYANRLIKELIISKEDSLKRNVLRLFQFLPVPEEKKEEMINFCFDILSDRKEPVAIQVFAMTVLSQLIEPFPELEKELILILEDNLPHASAGFRSRAKKVIHSIHKKR